MAIKYRIVKVTRGNGSVVFMPQYKHVLIWCSFINWPTEMPESFSQLKDAQQVIDIHESHRLRNTVIKREVIK